MGMAKQASRDVGRATIIVDGPFGLPATGILLRKLRGHRVFVIGEDQFQSLRDAPVQQPSPGRRYLRVGSLAEQVVGEVVAVPELLHDPAPPELVNRSYDHVGVEITCLGEQVKREVSADSCRETSDLERSRAELAEAVMQDRGQVPARQAAPAG